MRARAVALAPALAARAAPLAVAAALVACGSGQEGGTASDAKRDGGTATRRAASCASATSR